MTANTIKKGLGLFPVGRVSQNPEGNLNQRCFLKAVFVIGMLLLLTGIASFAQAPGENQENINNQVEQIYVPKAFTWLTKEEPDWNLGLFYGFLGLIGALVTIFGLIGGAVPGTAGKAKIDAENTRLEIWSKELDELIKDPSSDKDMINEVNKAVDKLRDDIRAEKWRQFGIASSLYAFLGIFFASMFAQDLIQAIIIGSGWTAIIGTLGLKRDYEERKSKKDDSIENIEKLSKEIEGLEKKLEGLISSARRAPKDRKSVEIEVLEKELEGIHGSLANLARNSKQMMYDAYIAKSL